VKRRLKNALSAIEDASRRLKRAQQTASDGDNIRHAFTRARRRVDVPAGAERDVGNLYQTTAPVTEPGYSGAPVQDANGAVIDHVVRIMPGVGTLIPNVTINLP